MAGMRVRCALRAASARADTDVDRFMCALAMDAARAPPRAARKRGAVRAKARRAPRAPRAAGAAPVPPTTPLALHHYKCYAQLARALAGYGGKNTADVDDRGEIGEIVYGMAAAQAGEAVAMDTAPEAADVEDLMRGLYWAGETQAIAEHIRTLLASWLLRAHGLFGDSTLDVMRKLIGTDPMRVARCNGGAQRRTAVLAAQLFSCEEGERYFRCFGDGWQEDDRAAWALWRKERCCPRCLFYAKRYMAGEITACKVVEE